MHFPPRTHKTYVPFVQYWWKPIFLLSSLSHPHPQPVLILLGTILELHGKSPWIKADTQVKNDKVKKKEPAV